MPFYTLWQWCRTLNIIFPYDQMHQKTHQFPLLFSPCLSLSSVTLSPCHMAVDLRFALLSLASPSPSLLCYIFCSLKPKSFLFLSSPALLLLKYAFLWFPDKSGQRRKFLTLYISRFLYSPLTLE